MKKCSLIILGLSLYLGGFSGAIDGLMAGTPIDKSAELAKLHPVKDPVVEEIYVFRLETRQAYNNSRFDELEAKAVELRASKAVFDNGSWKIGNFYTSFECRYDEPESMWQLHERIHKDWITAKPDSITARVAYANFLADYASHARGSGYASTVTKDGWRFFAERLDTARSVLKEARALNEQDPFWWSVSLRVALGQSWPKAEYDALVAEAKSFEPGFWGYDTARAYSLLPRWYGEPGDWEAYASRAAVDERGAGVEVYARITIQLYMFYTNIFRETQASWPKTRKGLEQLHQKYPRSLEIVNWTAMLATLAEDRALAKEMFAVLGDTYLPSVWGKPEKFLLARKWAEAGK